MPPLPALRSTHLLLLLAVVVAINFITMPAEEYRGDAEAARMETVTVLNDGTWAVPERIAAQFGVRGQYFYESANGNKYPKYGVLNTLIYLPAFALEKMATGKLSFETDHVLWLNLLNLVLSGLTAFYLALLARRYAASPLALWVFVLSSLYATFWWNYLRAHGFEIYLTLFAIAFYFHFTRAREVYPVRHFLCAGVFLGLLCLAKSVFVVWLPVALLLFPRGERQPARASLAFWLPVVLACLLVLLANWLKFGSPWNTGYTQWEKEPNLFTFDPRPALWGYFFSSDGGVFLYYPVFFFALSGWPSFLKEFRRDARLAIGLAVVLFCVCMLRVNWRGASCDGPRYLLPVLPLVSLPFVEVLNGLMRRGRTFERIAAGGLVACVLGYSLVLQVATNSLPFFFWNKLLIVSGADESSATNYLASHHFGMLDAGFLRYARGHSSGFVTGFVNELDPPALVRLEALKEETQFNYYWFRYSVEPEH